MKNIIQSKMISYNYSKRTTTIKYIVIHDTGNTNKGANALKHYSYFNSGNKNSSADYFVDDTTILRVLNDNFYSWHCGDGKGKKGITNNNSLGVELCINNDGNYDKAFNNLVNLVKYLMKIYNIPLSNVVRHYDASGKICPKSMSLNKWSKWNEFKQLLIEDTYKVKIDCNVLNVRKGANIKYDIVTKVFKGEVYTIIETCGEWGKLKSGIGWINLKYIKKI